MEEFKNLGLSPELLKKLETEKYSKPYPIQEQAIPAILNKKDVLGIAQTGSGKTASFVLPILMNLKGKTEHSRRRINTLVLVPTRELAIQVESVFKIFGESLPYVFKSMAVYGGVSINPQMIFMNNVNVLVATPGRLLELHRSKAMTFERLDTFVLDEADKMLNLGFKAEMDEIFDILPKRRQNLLFSATLSPEVLKIEKLLLNEPLVINIPPKEVKTELIEQLSYAVDEDKKGPLLRYIIKEREIKQALVFTSSTHKADIVANKLVKNGIKAAAIHSKKSQGNRIESLRNFKNGSLPILVTTDLLSRGIDIDFLPFVINYELPRSPKDFIHRIGRTGRAENPGEAITFVSKDELHHFKVILKKMKAFVKMIDASELDLFGNNQA